jgi:hypothetical protein
MEHVYAPMVYGFIFEDRSSMPMPKVQLLREETALIALMMKAVNISETSVNFYQTTRRNNQKTIIFIFAAVRT